MRGRQENFNKPSGLRIFQANVGRGGEAHDIALNFGYREGAKIIALQEPWVFSNLEQQTTKHHPGYEIYCPSNTWITRPRVLTYVRKSCGLQALQQESNICRDIVMVTLSGQHIPPFQLWNVYNAPTGSKEAGDAVARITSMELTISAVVLGDFNLRHREWDPSTDRSHPLGVQLADWMRANNLCLANPSRTPTHSHGGVLDLVMSNLVGIHTEIPRNLHSTSDHETLWTTIPGSRVPPSLPGRFRLTSIDSEKLLSLLRHSQKPASEDVEEEAQCLVQALFSALQGSTPRTRKQAVGAPWWTNNCQSAARTYHRARRISTGSYEQAALRRIVRAAKRTYWQNQVELASTLPKVYKIVKWGQRAASNCIPSLKGPAGPVVTPLAKAQLFRDTLLSRHTELEDVPAYSPTVSQRNIPWLPINSEETFNATCRTTASAPGKDEIPASVIKLAWPIIGERITTLFQQCANLGVHPSSFKHAEILILPKSGPRDRTLSKSYRPIALLSCLGKGLERLMARRLSYWALRLQILAQDQCSAVSKRLASDLTTALACDIEEAWIKKCVPGIITVDVKGAFDCVFRNRLLLRLREQGWPPSLIQWVSSFATHRTAQIHINGTVSEPFPVLCGLPQGSPVSPILFLLYIEPFHRLGRGRFGYADDGCILESGDSINSCHQALQQALNLTLQWGSENGICFDVTKTELQYFHRKRSTDEPPIQANNICIKPNHSTRWLGIVFDRKLTFQEHIRQATVRAGRITDQVKRLCGATFGANPRLLRQAVQGCAFTTLLYGAETWFARNSAKSATGKIQIAMNRAARAVLPAYRTTPVPALLRETGWAPAGAWLERIHDRLTVRVAAADPQHPLRQRWNSTRFRWIRARLDIERSGWTLPPPWISPDSGLKKANVGAVGREHGLLTFTAWEQQIQPLDLVVYSDGALQNGFAGAGYCIFGGRHALIAQGSLPLGPTAEAYDAEIIAALEGLRAALANPMARHATDLTVCLDNEEAAMRLQAGAPTATSFKAITTFRAIATTWRTRDRNLLVRAEPGSVNVRWCPGHQGLRGNELADKLAGAACQLPTSRSIMSVARAKSSLKAHFKNAFQTYWAQNAPDRYQALGLSASIGPPPELSLPRRLLGYLLAARSGHGDFALYHLRFNHNDAWLKCRCGLDKSPEHFVYCRLVAPSARFRALGSNTPRQAMQWALSTPKGATAFSSWCNRTAFYHNICTRRPADS